MNTDELIQSVLSAPEFLHLKKEVVTLPGRDEPFVPARKLLVIEQCGLTNSRMGRIERQVKENPVHYEFVDPMDKFGAARLYSELASITFGDVPTLLEFIAMLPGDTGVWLEKAIQINPSMFEWITELAKVVEQADLEYMKSLDIPVTEKKEDIETLKKKELTPPA